MRKDGVFVLWWWVVVWDEGNGSETRAASFKWFAGCNGCFFPFFFFFFLLTSVWLDACKHERVWEEKNGFGEC